MTQLETDSRSRGSGSCYIGYQLPKTVALNQASFSVPNHFDIFLAYTPESIPIMLGVGKIIEEEGFTPWQEKLETLLNSTQAEDPYQGIHQSDAFAIFLDGALEVPLDLKDELEQAIKQNKLIFIIARKPLESDKLEGYGLNNLRWLLVTTERSSILKELTRIMIGSLTHVRLQARALKWQRQNHDPKFLLSLGDIKASLEQVDWLKNHPSLSLLTTPEQNEFLDASQKQANQRTDYFQGKPPDIFISYSSQNRSFVKELGAALKRANLGIWVDHDNIPIATNWKKEVAEGIRAAHTFIFVITSYSLASEHCGWELQQARRHGRRIIPICARHDFEHESFRKAGLSSINYISFERQSFPDAIEQLIKSVGTDLSDVKVYNRLYSRAYDWSSHGRQQHLLLKQQEYQAFKKWQQKRQLSSSKVSSLQDLHVLQTEYMAASQIALSRDLAVQRSLRVVGVALGVAIISLTIGIAKATLGEIQALVASLNDKSGLDGIITALQASRGLEQNFLLSPISAELQLEARMALHQETLIARELNRLDGHERAAYGVAFSPDAEFIISTGQDQTVRIWSFSSSLMPPLVNHQNEVLAVEYSSDGDFFITGDANGVINLWSCKPTVLSRYQSQPENTVETNLLNQEGACQWIKALPGGPSAARIARITISPGSQYVAAATYDGNVYFWSRSSGSEFFQPAQKLSHGKDQDGRDQLVFGVDFSPKERVLVSADISGNVKVWSTESQQELASISVGDWVVDTRFSHDGRLIAIGGDKGLLKLWDWKTGQIIDLPGHNNGFVHVMFHPLERRLISADTEDGVINLWSPEILDKALNQGGSSSSNEPLQPISLLGHQGGITRIRFSAEGSYLASASVDDTIRLWLTEDGTLLDILRGHEDEVLNLAFSPERGGKYGQTYLASSSRDGTIRLWQINNDVRPLKHENRLYDVDFHPNGNVLASSGRGRISLWRLTDYKLLGRVNVDNSNSTDILSVQYSSNGEFLVAGDVKGNITLWRHPVDQYYPLQTAQKQKPPYRQWSSTTASIGEAKPSEEVAVVRFHPNSQIIASGGVDGVVRFWTTEGDLLGYQKIERDDYAITSLDFSKDGKNLVISSRSKVAGIPLSSSHGVRGGHIETYRVDIDDQSPQVSLSHVSTITESVQGAHSKGVLTVSFNPTNVNEFASGGEDGQIKIWDMNGQLTKTLDRSNSKATNKSNDHITRVDYSQDGQMLVASSEDGTIAFWNLSTGRVISSLKRHERQVAKVIFNPAYPTILASAGFDAQVLIWTIPDRFQDQPMQKLVTKGCLSADKYLDLAQTDADKRLQREEAFKQGEMNVRDYCLKKPNVREKLEEGEKTSRKTDL